MKLDPRPTGRPWTPAEDEQLLALLASGLDRPSIAQKLKRSVHAITSRERAFLEFFGRREANDAASQEERNVHRQPSSGASGIRKSRQTNEDRRRIGGNDPPRLEPDRGLPERGVKVTVYGLNPWNSMLTFGVDAGSVPNKTDLQSFCDIITERLKRLYDVGVEG